jgi:hypothetical protein
LSTSPSLGLGIGASPARGPEKPGSAGVGPGIAALETGISGHFTFGKARKCPEKPGYAGGKNWRPIATVGAGGYRACSPMLTNVDVC